MEADEQQKQFRQDQAQSYLTSGLGNMYEGFSGDSNQTKNFGFGASRGRNQAGFRESNIP